VLSTENEQCVLCEYPPGRDPPAGTLHRSQDLAGTEAGRCPTVPVQAISTAPDSWPHTLGLGVRQRRSGIARALFSGSCGAFPRRRRRIRTQLLLEDDAANKDAFSRTIVPAQVPDVAGRRHALKIICQPEGLRKKALEHPLRLASIECVPRKPAMRATIVITRSDEVSGSTLTNLYRKNRIALHALLARKWRWLVVTGHIVGIQIRTSRGLLKVSQNSLEA
jgi:hypothetical protein